MLKLLGFGHQVGSGTLAAGLHVCVFFFFLFFASAGAFFGVRVVF